MQIMLIARKNTTNLVVFQNKKFYEQLQMCSATDTHIVSLSAVFGRYSLFIKHLQFAEPRIEQCVKLVERRLFVFAFYTYKQFATLLGRKCHNADYTFGVDSVAVALQINIGFEFGGKFYQHCSRARVQSGAIFNFQFLFNHCFCCQCTFYLAVIRRVIG